MTQPVSSSSCSWAIYKADPVLECVPVVSTFTCAFKLFAKAVIAASLSCHLLTREKLHQSYYFTWVRKESKGRCVALLFPVVGQIGVGIYTFCKRKDFFDQRKRVAEKVELAKSAASQLPDPAGDYTVIDPIPPTVIDPIPVDHLTNCRNGYNALADLLLSIKNYEVPLTADLVEGMEKSLALIQEHFQAHARETRLVFNEDNEDLAKISACAFAIAELKKYT